MKLKLSWHHFFIVMLVILLLACLINYLEKNKLIEGLDQKDNNNKVTDTSGNEEIMSKEAFTNLSGAPVSSLGSNEFSDVLAPYEQYSCGPLNLNNFFGDVKFKPECCGNPAGSFYSNSIGCACICPEKWKYLNSRGGNRTFPSEY